MAAQAGSLSLPWMQPAVLFFTCAVLVASRSKGVALLSVYASSVPAVRRWTVWAQALIHSALSAAFPLVHGLCSLSARCPHGLLPLVVCGPQNTMWQYLLGPGGRLGSSFCHCFHRLRGKHTSRGNKELPTLPGDALKSLGLHPASTQAYIVIWWRPPRWIPFQSFSFSL